MMYSWQIVRRAKVGFPCSSVPTTSARQHCVRRWSSRGLHNQLRLGLRLDSGNNDTVHKKRRRSKKKIQDQDKTEKHDVVTRLGQNTCVEDAHLMTTLWCFVEHSCERVLPTPGCDIGWCATRQTLRKSTWRCFCMGSHVIFFKLREKTPALIPTQYTQDKM